ncbi:conserved hypothetical protein [Trichinella spiralis]|uniref:hypothetical protein n=1 Tax=Trichinella spiralis TaxID=6334 RepID=UPI0001EFC593|nr:conserved hypothetical protein [Trichinella spiralis]
MRIHETDVCLFLLIVISFLENDSSQFRTAQEKGAYQVVLIFDIAEYFIHCIAMEERTC